MSNVIFQIDGGIGKNIAATAVLSCIKNKYPKHEVIVVSGYPEVFQNNNDCYRSFNIGNLQYFYRDFVEDKNSIMLLHNPYNEADVIYGRKSLIETWCKMFDLPYKNEKPVININNREREMFEKNFVSDKPIMVIQTNGGAPNQQVKYSWARDIPMSIAQKVVNHFKDKYNIAHIRREDQPALEFTTPFIANFRQICCLLMMSEKRLLMDSFAAHACAALDLPSTVCWIANSPTVFGYNIHNNIKANPFTVEPDVRNSFINKFDITGNPIEFPYNTESEIFNVQDIIDSLTDKPKQPVVEKKSHASKK